jgi:hypothetical protein
MPAKSPEAAATGAVAHTKDDDVTFHPTRAVYVGDVSGGGAMKVDMADGNTAVVFSGIVAGSILPLSVTRIYATDTTAAGFVLLY